MEIRNSIDALKTLLGSPTAATPTGGQRAKSESPEGIGSLAGDRATLSSAGSGVSQAAAAPDTRLEKVAAVQAALAAGTYQVPAAAVAQKVVDSMLSQGESSGSEPSAPE
ncbi:MAG TPA: flagellar biosynthesis anti-sigma factor FlgM [Terracidiphilus sp.]